MSATTDHILRLRDAADGNEAEYWRLVDEDRKWRQAQRRREIARHRIAQWRAESERTDDEAGA